MKFEFTKDYEGLVITTRWKKAWYQDKRSVTGIIKLDLLCGVQLWYNLNEWTWLEISCDMRSFKILPKEEAIIWRIEHNM